MPEFLFCLILAGVFAALKRQQIRFIYAHFQRTFTDKSRIVLGDPYRNNPEVERDRYREEAQQLKEELTRVRMERDLATQNRDMRVLTGRAKLGSAFALGALTCFTSVNIAPQVAHDLLTERPAYARHVRLRGEERQVREDLMVGLLTMNQRFYPYYSCAPHTCCHRLRLHISFSPEFSLRIEPTIPAIQFFWIRSPEVADLLATSGGEEPLNDPQAPQPVWIERYAITNSRENIDWAPIGATITMTLD